LANTSSYFRRGGHNGHFTSDPDGLAVTVRQEIYCIIIEEEAIL